MEVWTRDDEAWWYLPGARMLKPSLYGQDYFLLIDLIEFCGFRRLNQHIKEFVVVVRE